MVRTWLIVLGLVAALLVASWPSASGTNLLVNGGFEDGTDGWSSNFGQLEVVTSPVHGGSQAAQLTGASIQAYELYQWVDVLPDASYEFTGWTLLDDPAVQSVFLRVSWFDTDTNLVSTVDSPSLTIAAGDYQHLATGQVTSPAAARSARVSVRVQVSDAFIVYFDDISFEGPLATPSPTPSSEPAATPTATPTETPPPTVAPTITPTPSLAATTSPTVTPTATATATPQVTPSASAIPTPTPTTSAAPSPVATLPGSATPPAPAEPPAFVDLTNGGFETLREDGTPFGWRKVGGEMAVTHALRVEGDNALSFTSRTASTKWVYQTLSVNGDAYYEAGGYASKPDPSAKEVFLRLSWYDSEDGSGAAIESVDSTEILGAAGTAFTKLSTGAVQAPADARSAKVKLMLRPASDAETTVYFDAISFQEAEPPAPTPAPTPSATSVATPTGSAPAPSATPAPTGDPTPEAEPDVFATLTNGSFETQREDGTPYGWRKAGGEMAATPDFQTEGDYALSFTSRTASTKWVYQTVAVEPGASYEASAQALNSDAGAESVFLRVSWYASENGDGNAIESVDSIDSLMNDALNFRRLTTGAVQAPSDARSAKVKLMLRPAPDAEATVYFDDVRFVPAPSPPAATASPDATHTPTATPIPKAAPAVFRALTNGGFEQMDAGGAPYGWREVGAEIAVTDAVHFEGGLALVMTSRSGSTKWVYQTVLVEPGDLYEATAQAANVNARDVFLRLSWYANEDGSGEAIDSVDSTGSAGADGGGFRRLATGAVRAPSEAQSAKVRLMLRPASGEEAIAYFDAVTFAETSGSSTAGAAGRTQPSLVSVAGLSGNPAPGTPAVLGAVSAPVKLANVKPAPVEEQRREPAPGGGYDWAAFLGIGVALASLSAAGGYELWRRNPREGEIEG